MLLANIAQFALVIFGIFALAVPVGIYMARVINGQAQFLSFIERPIYFLCGIHAKVEQNCKNYIYSLLCFDGLAMVAVYLLLTHQNLLPLNPLHLPGLSPHVAFNIAVSFVTQTNWQSYTPEKSLSVFSQMFTLLIPSFVAPATAIAVIGVIIRGFIRQNTHTIGNFYVDVIRALIYILLPLAFIFAIFLIHQGVPQNLTTSINATSLEQASQTIPQGSVAARVAIKQIGVNGAGYFNANGSHPYENPTSLSIYFQMLAAAALSLAGLFAFGWLIKDMRQITSLLTSMSFLFLIVFALSWWGEAHTIPSIAHLGIDQTASTGNLGGNMEGKEVRVGIMNSSLWTMLITATSTGTNIAAHNSFTPLGLLATILNILLGSIQYGGLMSSLLMYIFITVLIAGLMVGRTPEYLGKKIDTFELKCAMLPWILHPCCILTLGMMTILLSMTGDFGHSSWHSQLIQVIYGYASTITNNGSTIGGFAVDRPYQNIILGLVMLIGRYSFIIPWIMIAGSLASKKTVPPSTGTFPTNGAIFAILLACVVVIFGCLTYFPILAMGPITGHLTFMHQGAL